MQRTKLFVKGITLPKLGSVQDRVLREYLTMEADLEAHRSRFSMLATLTNPTFTDAKGSNKWYESIKSTWNSYLSKLFNVEETTETKRDVEMMEFYTNVVKNLRPKLGKHGKQLRVTGLEDFVKAFNQSIQKQKGEAQKEQGN